MLRDLKYSLAAIIVAVVGTAVSVISYVELGIIAFYISLLGWVCLWIAVILKWRNIT